MKVKHYPAVPLLVFVLILLTTSDSATAGWTPPPRPASFLPGNIVPSWALPISPSHSPGEGEPESGPIEPELQRALLEAEPGETLRVIVTLQEQTALQQAVLPAASRAEARAHLVVALQSQADRTQAPLRAYLEGAQAAGLVESYTPFWIFDGIGVCAGRETIFALAARPDVAAIHLDHYRQWLPNIQHPISNLQSPASSVEWGIARIRADQVWSALHISGTGVVVAGVDTGVDWLHPALETSYRGYNPHGPANHTYSWHDATGGGALYPVDGHGHGSHTLGTIAGQDGIGVAPGARWIGVKVLSSQGYGYDSWIHEGFQWLLAPGGDPAQAPDVINCSWGNPASYLTTFQPDLQALRAAGVFPVFSNGNDGPSASTVGSPASLPEAFAVGATDSDDEVANFSSRGPSPWNEIRPHVAAPGVDVRSALPGGSYGEMNGTSMAAPHVSGIVALLRSVSPTLSITHTAYVITSTAIPLTITAPNNDSGWGRVDAFAAVAALAHPGFITGTVRRAGDNATVADATVVATPHGGGGGGTATSDDDGDYLLALAPTTYDLTASAFGYEPATVWGVVVTTGTTTVRNFTLTSLPTGTLRGHVTDATTGDPVVATITVLNTPVETTASQYTFALPEGNYVVRARSLGYRVVTRTVQINAGSDTVADFALPPAPSILLVDSGRWYYGSQASYFRQPLDELAYAYDEWDLKHLPDDVPSADDLSTYDIVIWSAPQDAPGYIGAEDAIVGYLSAGGRLFLSGQDVGFWDGGGAMLYGSAYYGKYLKAGYLSDNAPTRVLEGLGTDVFAGMTLTITGAGGADNQNYPDEVVVKDPDAAALVLAYQDGEGGGVCASTCLDYRVIYLSFGFEGINDADTRREVMGRALDWLVSPPPTVGLELTPASQTRIGLPSTVVTHAVRVRHVGQAGVADTVSLSLDGASWPSELSAPSLSLAPCTSATVVLSVTIPPAATWDDGDTASLIAHSSLSPALALSATLTTKVPAPILLVDDDRWYDQEDKYEAALAAGDFSYDYWRTGFEYGEPPGSSPPLDILQRYPVVVWFTGYDWYAPVTSEEEEILADYLDGGGRLFLSSQDYLYYHYGGDFSQDYLGVMTYTEDVTPTLASGVLENPIGDRLGPYPLDYPFRNWSDALVPTPGTAVSFRDQERRAIALARRPLPSPPLVGEGGYAVAFFPFPFETLPEAGRAEVMERLVGWLSWMGGSTFAAESPPLSPPQSWGGGTPLPQGWGRDRERGLLGGDTLTYTVALRNDGPETVGASLSNTLPVSLTFVPGSLTSPAAYDAPTRRVSWEGPLGPGAAITFTYRVTVVAGLPTGTTIVNTARLGLEDHAVRFHRAAVVRVDAPDFSSSALSCAPSPARPGVVVTCTLTIANSGPGDAPAAEVTNLLPADTTLVPGFLAWEGGGVAEAVTGTVRWTGPLSAGGRTTVTYRISLPSDPVHPPLYSVAFLEDGTGWAWERAMWLHLDPWRVYMPVACKHYFKPRLVYLPLVWRDGS